MNLQNLEVQELSVDEKNATEGGLLFIFVVAVAYGYTKQKFATGEWCIE